MASVFILMCDDSRNVRIGIYVTLAEANAAGVLEAKKELAEDGVDPDNPINAGELVTLIKQRVLEVIEVPLGQRFWWRDKDGLPFPTVDVTP